MLYQDQSVLLEVDEASDLAGLLIEGSSLTGGKFWAIAWSDIDTYNVERKTTKSTFQVLVLLFLPFFLVFVVSVLSSFSLSRISSGDIFTVTSSSTWHIKWLVRVTVGGATVSVWWRIVSVGSDCEALCASICRRQGRGGGYQGRRFVIGLWGVKCSGCIDRKRRRI